MIIFQLNIVIIQKGIWSWSFYLEARLLTTDRDKFGRLQFLASITILKSLLSLKIVNI